MTVFYKTKEIFSFKLTFQGIIHCFENTRREVSFAASDSVGAHTTYRSRETVSNHVIRAAKIFVLQRLTSPTEMLRRDHLTLGGKIIIMREKNVIFPLGTFEDRKHTDKQTNRQTDKHFPKPDFCRLSRLLLSLFNMTV